MAELRSKFTVPLQHLFWRMNLLVVASTMGSNLRRACALSSNLLQVFFDLLTTWTRCFQILLRISLDFRLAMLTAFNLVTKTLQPHRKLGSIYAGRILLRLEKTALLKSARLAIVPLGHIENDRVSMKLRRGIAIHRTSGVMLEGRGDELARRLRRMDVADARLGIPLQFIQRYANTFAVRLTYTIIATHKGGERNRLRRRECRIPSGAMF